MRFLPLVIFGSLFFQAYSIFAIPPKSPFTSNIRVRLFKDLATLPQVPKANLKLISNRIWSLEGMKLYFQEKQLSERNFIIKKENNKFDLIGVFDFNNYLVGVLSKEMPLSWPLEALKAQAVVARSFALARINEGKNKIFHVDSDQMDQVFSVSNSEKAKLAVLSTDQVILKDQKNKILKAFYHADCGGQTVPASEVWSDAINSGTALDPWCAERKSNEWSFTIAKDQFYQRLTVENSPYGSGEVAIKSKFKNRILSIQWIDQVFSVQKLRQFFGFAVIRNSPLSITETDTDILFKGKGFGHGAGLCQWGTLAQAKLGRSYTQILEHYYPDAEIANNTMKLSKNFLSDLVFN